MRGIHQSSALSEMSSQFHDECSAVPGRFCIERCGASGVARRNFVFGPRTFTTGWRPMVLVTTPPHPASKARMMLASDSVGGAEDSRNGLLNRRPVKVVASVTLMADLLRRTVGSVLDASTITQVCIGNGGDGGNGLNRSNEATEANGEMFESN